MVEELLQAARDVLVVAEADLAVEKVALQDGVGTSIEDLDEDRGDEVRDEEDDKEGCVGRAHLDHSVHHEEGDKSSDGSDEELGDEHEAASNAFNEAELGGVLKDEDEGVDG